MASLALSMAGSAIGGPIGGMIGGFVGGMIDNVLFPQKTTPPPPITSSTYGQALPLPYGRKVRTGANMIWTSGWYKSSGKVNKLADLKGLPPQYQADLAFACFQGPLQPGWVLKLIANGNLIFDSSRASVTPAPDANGVVTWGSGNQTHKDFTSLVVYPGNGLQTPDPTIEAKLGIGNVAAYRGTAYFVINGLIGTPFGNAVPSLNVIAQPQASITLAEVVSDICARSGIDTNTISTSALTHTVEGYVLDSQTDAVSALQPLALCYDFDVAEVGGTLRFVPRGQSPICSITSDQLAGHESGSPRPSFEWPRAEEMSLPRVAALTFADWDRDCLDNTQSARRLTGSAQSNISTRVRVTLTSDEARKIADRMLWEAHYGRQQISAATSDRLGGFVESAQTYAVEVPFGFETVRVTKRSRGANGVIEFEGKRDAPSIYASAAPSASAGAFDNNLGLGGPVNPPFFVQPPSSGFPGVSGRALIIGISGGDGTFANDAWGGCSVYVATDDVTSDYQLIGVQFGPTCMGKLSAGLASYGGANPDTTSGHTLSVDLNMSDGEPSAQSAQDAQDAITPYVIGAGAEYLTAQLVSAVGGEIFNLTKLWRNLYGTSGGSHSAGDKFMRIDSSAFHWPIPDAYGSGRTLYFRFVSAGETIAGAVTYPYTLTA